MSDSPRVSGLHTQARHGFTRLTAVRFDGTNWVRAQAGDLSIGLVGSIPTSDTFEYITGGEVDGLSGLVPGEPYYVGPNGQLTRTINGAPIFQAYTARRGFLVHASVAPETAAIQPDAGLAARITEVENDISRLESEIIADPVGGGGTTDTLHDERYLRRDIWVIDTDLDGDGGEIVIDTENMTPVYDLATNEPEPPPLPIVPDIPNVLPVTAGLQLWLRSDDLGALGTNISAWPDRSGNGRDFSAASSVGTVAAGRNGFNVASLSGSLAFKDGSDAIADGDDFTIFLVTVPGDGTFLSRGSGNGFPAPGFSIAAGAVGFAVVCGGFQYNCGLTYSTPSGENFGGFGWYTFSREKSNNGEMKFYSAGNLHDTVNSNTVVMRSHAAGDYDLLGNGAPGHVGELIIYNRLLSSGERALVDSYLRGLWNFL